MRQLLFLFILIFSQSTFAHTLVRVRIATLNTPKIDVAGFGLVFQGDVPSFQKASIPQTQRVQIELKDFAKKIWSYGQDDQLKTVYSDFLTLEGQNLQVHSQFVPSKILFWAREPKKIDVIAVLDLDDYLNGVLPFEMPLTWPTEALKAQAVVSRSFVLSMIKERGEKPYHVDSTVNDQMYRYSASISKGNHEKLQKILLTTKDEVLMGPNGVLKALYHSDCGGQTEKASNVWGSRGLEVSVKDDFCLLRAPWKYFVSPQELKSKLELRFLPQEISVLSMTDSGRVGQVLVASNSESKSFSSQEFRKLVGYSKVRSTQFIISKINNSFEFQGRGFGHGVGMCQWGARQWAKQGLSYKMILKHYFPGYKVGDETL